MMANDTVHVEANRGSTLVEDFEFLRSIAKIDIPIAHEAKRYLDAAEKHLIRVAEEHPDDRERRHEKQNAIFVETARAANELVSKEVERLNGAREKLLAPILSEFTATLPADASEIRIAFQEIDPLLRESAFRDAPRQVQAAIASASPMPRKLGNGRVKFETLIDRDVVEEVAIGHASDSARESLENVDRAIRDSKWIVGQVTELMKSRGW